MWHYRGRNRPDLAEAPEPGQESVWDYPRPPEMAPDGRLVAVYHGDQMIASSRRTCRVLESASQPPFYIPSGEVNRELLSRTPGSSVYEWKGVATHWTLSSIPSAGVVGWSYPDPTPASEQIRDYISFHPLSPACYVSGERVRAQSDRFYGGWITREIVGLCKGETGTEYR